MLLLCATAYVSAFFEYGEGQAQLIGLLDLALHGLEAIPEPEARCAYPFQPEQDVAGTVQGSICTHDVERGQRVACEVLAERDGCGHGGRADGPVGWRTRELGGVKQPRNPNDSTGQLSGPVRQRCKFSTITESWLVFPAEPKPNGTRLA
jgi:hypothetical protein